MSYGLSDSIIELRERISDLEKLIEPYKVGRWAWADVYETPDEKHNPNKNPNENVFTRVWVPDE